MPGVKSESLSLVHAFDMVLQPQPQVMPSCPEVGLARTATGLSASGARCLE